MGLKFWFVLSILSISNVKILYCRLSFSGFWNKLIEILNPAPTVRATYLLVKCLEERIIATYFTLLRQHTGPATSCVKLMSNLKSIFWTFDYWKFGIFANLWTPGKIVDFRVFLEGVAWKSRSNQRKNIRI